MENYKDQTVTDIITGYKTIAAAKNMAMDDLLGNTEMDDWFIDACGEGNLDTVKYLLTSKELSVHANIHARHDDGLIAACAGGYLPLVRFLLTSSQLRERANLHAKDDDAFIWACKIDNPDLLVFFLYECNFQLKPNVLAKLNEKIGDPKKIDNVFKLVARRDLYRKLNNAMKDKDTKTNTKI